MSGGTGERIKRYYTGWCQFLKDCIKQNGTFQRQPVVEPLPEVDLYFIDGNGLITKIDMDGKLKI